jgi:hypothetical protein
MNTESELDSLLATLAAYQIQLGRELDIGEEWYAWVDKDALKYFQAIGFIDSYNFIRGAKIENYMRINMVLTKKLLNYYHFMTL